MAIGVDELRAAAHRRISVLAKSQATRTAFLSHSHKDAELANGVAALLTQSGWLVYIDWLDEEMPSSPNRVTAQRIKERIVNNDYFLFLATANSMASRWCPWEIGYADGKKHIDRILIVPTSDRGTVHGNEYLQLYRMIDRSSQGDLAVWQPGQTTGGTLVRNL
jgi:hypothetical protein